MRLYVTRILIAAVLAAAAICVDAGTGMASPVRIIRLGYLDDPGSALCQIAATKGHFREEGLEVELVKFKESNKGLAALETGLIDVGAFTVGDSLRAIAGGRGFRIIAGGGAPVPGNPLADLDEAFQTERECEGVVVLIPRAWPISDKGTIIQLTAALIRAYRTNQSLHSLPPAPGSRPDSAVRFDPNPDYWRLERLWRSLGLQENFMKRDFLANHVYEEIYCDALDRLLLGPIDPLLLALFSKAICTPNCCPANAAKL